MMSWSTKVVIHSFRNVSTGRICLFKRKLNPGIQKRAQLISEHPDKTLSLEELENIEQYESDFMDVHMSHREHMQELRQQHEKLKMDIVRQKYFKVKYPNFLTWNDKEHIKYLYRTDPEEWTIEKLSEGFPALPGVISKIVKGKWKKDSQEAIEKHDDVVQENWKKFKENQFPDFPPKLISHLKKFTTRSLNFQKFVPPIPKVENEIIVKNANIKPVFSEIITSLEKLKNKDKKSQVLHMTEKIKKKVPEGETYVLGSKRKKIFDTEVTLQSLQKNLQMRDELGLISDAEKLILTNNNLDKENCSTLTEKKIDEGLNQIEKHKLGSVAVESPERKFAHLIYPDRINIPEKILEKGGTYKVNDCYYDWDGQFLYRVPGMN